MTVEIEAYWFFKEYIGKVFFLGWFVGLVMPVQEILVLRRLL
jgi:hypothetical protein